MTKIRSLGVSPTGIETFELSNKNGLRLEIMTYGARLHRLFVPTKQGNFIDILAGFNTVDEYRTPNPYFNAIIGRVANRIKASRFTLNGKTYLLHPNEGNNFLHGGDHGFEHCMFTPHVHDDALELTYLSPAGEENFPGTMDFSITYRLTDDDRFVLEYNATTDEDTLCNLTNHAYFNLNGDNSSVLPTVVYINSHKFTEADEELVVKDKITDVTGTAFDFTLPKPVGRDIDKENPIFRDALGGYDFNYILNENSNLSTLAASAYSPTTGIELSVYTDRPCLQFYSGNFLDGSVTGKYNYPYQSAFCFESQGYPNACNIPSFPPIVLHKNECFKSTTIYSFSVR